MARGLTASGIELHAYVRHPGGGDGAHARDARIGSAGVHLRRSIGEAVESADVVIAAVPAAAATEVVAACARYLKRGQLYIDPSSSLPEVKRDGAARVGPTGADYADVAVMGTVVTAGALVPMLAAGNGAQRWRDEASAAGLNVTVLDGPPGAAALVKLLRSVFMKGRDALVLETVLAAQRHGVLDAVLSSIGGAGEQVPFPSLAERVMCSLAVYAERRADELADAASLLREAGVDPVMTQAGEARLRLLAESGLRDRFGGERPRELSEVLDCLEALAGVGS